MLQHLDNVLGGIATDICTGVHAPVRMPVLTGVVLDPAHTERFDDGVIYPTKDRDDVRSVTQRATDGIVYEQSFETQHPVAELCGVLGLDVANNASGVKYDGHLRLVVSRAEHGNWMWCEWYTPGPF